MSFSPESLLQLTILAPLLGALGIIGLGGYPNLRESFSILISLTVLYGVISLYSATINGTSVSVQWLTLLPGLDVSFEIEPLGMLFSMIAGFLWPITTIYSIGYMRGHNEQHQTRFFACFAIAISSTMGVAYAGNLFTLFVFYEILTLSTYPLVTHAGTDEAKLGGRVYLGILLSTSIVFFLLAVIGTWSIARTLDFQEGGVFDSTVSSAVTGMLLVLFFIASLSIVGLPPTGGTWSKWYLFAGILQSDHWMLVIVLILSTLLNIAYLLVIPIRAFFWQSEMQSSHTRITEAPVACLLALSTTPLLCLTSFFYPQHLYELTSSILHVGQ